jgi:hypothetical protein
MKVVTLGERMGSAMRRSLKDRAWLRSLPASDAMSDDDFPALA